MVQNYVNGKENIADVFTKELTEDKFTEFFQKMNLVRLLSPTEIYLTYLKEKLQKQKIKISLYNDNKGPLE